MRIITAEESAKIPVVQRKKRVSKLVQQELLNEKVLLETLQLKKVAKKKGCKK